MWFIGDLANFWGSTWAGLVPTVIALAIYFCIADTILITQCLYYRYINSRKPEFEDAVHEQVDSLSQPLLARNSSDTRLPGSRRRSSVSQKRQNSSLATSALPSIPEQKLCARPWITNALSVAAVCAIGVTGWTIAWQANLWQPSLESDESGDVERQYGAEFLGYISAALYLG